MSNRKLIESAITKIVKKVIRENANLDQVVQDFINNSGTGSKFWDEKYGVKTVNAAIKQGLASKKIRLSSKGNPMIGVGDTYGLNSALRHRSFSIIAN